MRFNAFCPGGLVPPGVFTGRAEEIVALEKMLFQTKHGNPQHFLVHGERGIGKSSLLFLHQLIASGEIDALNEGVKFSFLPVNAILEPADSYESIVRKLGAGLRRALSEHQKTKELARSAWDFLSRWEVMGVKYKSPEVSATGSELLDELVHSFASARAETEGKLDGILILIDEGDKPETTAHLGALLKGFSERLTRTRRNNVAIGVAGVSGLLDKLKSSHESCLRMFTSFHLKPLSRNESIEVVRKGIGQSNEQNGASESTKITEDAEGLIAMFSEGYPHFIQQFAYCAFQADTDFSIDEDDVVNGAWGEHGAFEQLGTKYFQDLYFDRIASDEYRQVLQVMAEKWDGWVTKEEIRSQAKLKETTLTNALKTLVARNIILPQLGHRGVYRIPLKSFAAWIRAYYRLRNSTQPAEATSEK